MARRLFTLLAASLLLVAAACGTDDDAKDETDPTDESSTTTEDAGGSEAEDGGVTTTTGDDDGGGGDGSNPEFCEASEQPDTLFDDIEEDDYDGLVEAVKAADDDFDAYVDSLPDDLKEEGELQVEAVRELAEVVDDVKDDPDVEAKIEDAYTALTSPDLEAAGEATQAYEDEVCPAD